ncbi:MAG: ATP-binding protein [Oligoflexia bacterium]|nr:ATP-binding protein [Oligoflexia bacterium]MBF0364286.1 ATP-binding protein [Oligoflexia bacterium]
MSKIKELFFKEAFLENRMILKSDVLRFLEYLNSGGDEGTQFDAKDIGKILNHNQLVALDKVKTELGKHLSAFANTTGGLIALGIREERDEELLAQNKNLLKFSINSYEIEKLNLQHILRAISTAVEPKIDFSIDLVKMEEDSGQQGKGRGVLLIFVEQGLTPPYQVVYNRSYYFRHGESSFPAPHSLVSALFSYRRSPTLHLNLIKYGNPSHYRLLISNKGRAPALHAHIIINIYPRLMKGEKLLLNYQQIKNSTDGLWSVKCLLGSHKNNSMKFRFRALPGEIILPEVNEVLFDFPAVHLGQEIKLTADLYCEGFADHQEFTLSL